MLSSESDPEMGPGSFGNRTEQAVFVSDPLKQKWQKGEVWDWPLHANRTGRSQRISDIGERPRPCGDQTCQISNLSA